jgi:lysozyme family protein
MANFKQAFDITSGNEGGYSNDPADSGGETYRGISRKYHPSWSGWVIVDSYKTKPGFPKNMAADVQLNNEVESFYKMLYWDINLLDDFSSQEVANEMYDTSVNMGTVKAAKFLQKALNVLNKNGSLYTDLVEDGKIGFNTLKAMKTCIDAVGAEFIYKVLNILQGNQYIEIMTNNPTQEKFALGWLRRVDFIKK